MEKIKPPKLNLETAARGPAIERVKAVVNAHNEALVELADRVNKLIDRAEIHSCRNIELSELIEKRNKDFARFVDISCDRIAHLELPWYKKIFRKSYADKTRK